MVRVTPSKMQLCLKAMTFHSTFSIQQLEEKDGSCPQCLPPPSPGQVTGPWPLGTVPRSPWWHKGRPPTPAACIKAHCAVPGSALITSRPAASGSARQ